MEYLYSEIMVHFGLYIPHAEWLLSTQSPDTASSTGVTSIYMHDSAHYSLQDCTACIAAYCVQHGLIAVVVYIRLLF